MLMKSAIALKNVTYFYPSSTTPALEEVSLEIREGEFVVIAWAIRRREINFSKNSPGAHTAYLWW
jgi:hypothetical protein